MEIYKVLLKMGFGAKSLRYRKITLQKISAAHKEMLRNVHNYEEMLHYSDTVSDLYFRYYYACDLGSSLKKEKKDEFYRNVDKILIDNWRSWVIQVLDGKLVALETVYDMIYRQPFDEDMLVSQLETIVDNWVLANKGPVVPLSQISNNRQSVHEHVVEHATTKGISILVEFPVPLGQKTIAEIEAAFESFGWDNVLEKVISDMKDWGSRESVMKKGENLYRKVLRGLWAKMKTYEGEVRTELIKRLWEECMDSVEMCADGHVGRLVNVLSGFDDDFGPQISKMEYFQNNIALIAANDLATPEAKIQHAKKLMDDVGIPEEEREAWLEAL
jgi:hypothetical protein